LIISLRNLQRLHSTLIKFIEKAVPAAFANGIEDIAVYPERVKSFK
jgi:hypothetical protein